MAGLVAREALFKNANATALPDDLAYRQDRQVLLQERLARLERERASNVNQRNEVVSLFEATGALRNNQPVRPRTAEEQQLEALELELAQALSVYSESNPRVVLLRSRIEQLEKTVQEDAGLPEEEEGAEPVPSEAELRFDLTLREIDQRIRDMDDEISGLQEELQALTVSIAATAENAILLEGLERDYDNLQQRYNNALNNLNQARMSERVEASAQGQRITTIENATVPQDPSGPNRMKIMAVGVAGGLGLAAGFFMLLEVINRRIRRPAEIQSRFGVIPIATIPYMETAPQMFRRRVLLVCAFLLALTGVPAILFYIDTTYMPLDILANKVLDRFGLI